MFTHLKWTGESNFLELIPLYTILMWCVMILFLLCEPGARVTNQFEEFGDELSQCPWYSLTTEMQRMYVIFLTDSQRPANLSSYGGIVCERDTFKKVAIIWVNWKYRNFNFSFLFEWLGFKRIVFIFHDVSKLQAIAVPQTWPKRSLHAYITKEFCSSTL